MQDNMGRIRRRRRFRGGEKESNNIKKAIALLDELKEKKVRPYWSDFLYEATSDPVEGFKVIEAFEKASIKYYRANINEMLAQQQKGVTLEELLKGKYSSFDDEMRKKEQDYYLFYNGQDEAGFDWTKFCPDKKCSIKVELAFIDAEKNNSFISFKDMEEFKNFVFGSPIVDCLSEIKYCVTWNSVTQEFEKYLYAYVWVFDNSPYVWAKNCETLNSFTGYKWCHGLAAYSGGNALDKARAILNNPQMELCCSFEDQQIGPIGLYITGDCKVASNIDLASRIYNEARYYDSDSWRSKALISSPEEIDESQWDHGEGIITNIKIPGFWVKAWYLNDPESEIIISDLKQLLGCEPTIVGKRRNR